MKQFLAILLLLAVSYQLVAKMGVIVWYEANRDYVATELCENRQQPSKQCKGKCYLKKQLNNIDQETDTQQETPVKKHKTELPEYIVNQTTISFSLNTAAISTPTPVYVNTYYFQPLVSIFHPPPVFSTNYLQS